MADATHTTLTPKFDRRAILRTAWTLYRETYEMFCRVRFDRRGFQWAMREAWRRAKAAARKAMIPAEEREARAASIRVEIEMLKYKPFAVSIERIERRLRAQLEAIV